MAEMYVEDGYAECDYFEGDCPVGVKEVVKVFGFSRNRVIIPTAEDPAEEIRRDFRKKFGRKAFTFPDQVLQTD